MSELAQHPMVWADPFTAAGAPFSYDSPCRPGVLEAVAAQAAADTTARIRAAIASSPPCETAADAASAAAAAAAFVRQKRGGAAPLDSRPNPRSLMWKHACIPAAPALIPHSHHVGQPWQLPPPAIHPATGESQAHPLDLDGRRSVGLSHSTRTHEFATCSGDLILGQQHPEAWEQRLSDLVLQLSQSKQTICQMEEDNHHLKKALELSGEAEKALRKLLEEEERKAAEIFHENELLKSELEETRRTQSSSIGAYQMSQSMSSSCHSPTEPVPIAMIPSRSRPANAKNVPVVEVDMTQDIAHLKNPRIT
eukprot:TRINITY_DN71981_c0_g1_i1.p1 TRINITY_DN71981_c0_g1~~TRINITY_DN71981_c0_g1_i1.p1  ORF type:complete len:309 (+),score=46.08 TRINITY_DN71981_c0_g1_i1:175-1101(+)